MSCAPRPIGTVSRFALPYVLTLLACPLPAFSQSSVCHAIRAGETATQLARRLTGDGRNTYQPWFQIVDGASRSVPKSQYDRIRRGWRACIVKETRDAVVQPVAHRDTQESPAAAASAKTSASPSPTPSATVATTIPVMSALSGIDLTLVWVAAAVALPLAGWKFADDYMARRKTALLVMRHFAHRFVREFERPLVQQPTEVPLRARLRLRPARRRLDILLAPGEGRRYPNLADHRKNVEYDVVRIATLLADESFVREPLYTHAEWVVVPFRFNLGRKHTGVT